MKKTFTLVVIFVLAAFFTAAAQTNEELANEKLSLAIDLMDQGSYKESLLLLDEAEKLLPGTFIYDYERAYAWYSQEDYARALKLLKKASKFSDATALVYQMMGNAYDLSGNPRKAIDAYVEGMKRFPGSGRLFMEAGVVYMRQDDYGNALSYFLSGMESDPYYPSNYYRAAYLFLNSSEKIWGLVYGETFMNLERTTDRTATMGGWLYDAYKESAEFPTDSTFKFNLTADRTINWFPEGDIEIPFPIAFELSMEKARKGEREISLASLDRIRTRFIEDWFENGDGFLQDEYGQPVLRFQKKVLDAGHYEAYNYWLLGDADPGAFNAWLSDNEEKYGEFVDWMNANRMKLE